MIEKIKIFNDKINSLNEEIKNQILNYLKYFNYETPSKDFQIIEINEEKNLNDVFYKEAFYIILTDYNFKDNKCTFQINSQKAIYRGHSYTARKRLKSHLANENYQLNRRKYDPNYKVCLKIHDKINGINIDKEPFKNWKWTIIIHKMPKSNKTIRERAELAFDELYNRPCKSREI